MRKKIDSYIGFAKRSGNLVTGTGTCEVMASRGKLKLLIIAIDTSDGTMKKMKNMAKSGGIPYRVYGSSEALSHMTGTSGRNVFGITDGEFAKTIAKEIDSEVSDEKEVF